VFIDDKGKLFGKISIIDILVVCLILGGIAGAYYKFGRSNTISPFVKPDRIEMTFFTEDVVEFVGAGIKAGDLVKDRVLVLSLFSGCKSGTKTEATKASTSAAAATTAAQTTAASNEKKTFSWATWALSEESLKPTYMAMAQTFMDANPNVTIETVAYPYAQYKDQLVISAAASNAPDIAHVKAEWVPALLKLGALQNLNDVLSPELKKDYFEAILKGVTVDGKIISAPWFTNPYALYYNKTLMEKAGIKELPKNWTELMAAARKISALGKDEKGNKIYGYALSNNKSAPGSGYNFFPHMWTFGGEFCDANGNITIYTPENVKAFEEAKSLYVDEISPNGSTFKDLEICLPRVVSAFITIWKWPRDQLLKQAPKEQISQRNTPLWFFPQWMVQTAMLTLPNIIWQFSIPARSYPRLQPLPTICQAR